MYIQCLVPSGYCSAATSFDPSFVGSCLHLEGEKWFLKDPVHIISSALRLLQRCYQL